MPEKSSYAALFSADATGSVMTARTPTDLRDDDDKVDFGGGGILRNRPRRRGRELRGNSVCKRHRDGYKRES